MWSGLLQRNEVLIDVFFKKFSLGFNYSNGLHTVCNETCCSSGGQTPRWIVKIKAVKQ